MLHLFFFQGKIMFYKYKFQNREMRGISSKAVHFVPLSKNPCSICIEEAESSWTFSILSK